MSIRSSILLTSLLLVPACQSTAPTGFTAADRDAILALDAAFPKMVMAADWANLARTYYAADAVLLPPNEPGVAGRAQIEASFKAWPPVQNMVLRSEDIAGSGDIAYSRGTWEMTVQTPNGPVTDKGKCLALFRRQTDGSWKSTHDTWNSDLPAPAAK